MKIFIIIIITLLLYSNQVLAKCSITGGACSINDLRQNNNSSINKTKLNKKVYNKSAKNKPSTQIKKTKGGNKLPPSNQNLK